MVPRPAPRLRPGKPVKVVAYIDFICPVCKNFETQYNETLTNLRNEGKITVEYRPLGFLDRQSTTNYSSRAANAAACVVNESPEKYAEFVNVLFENQPAEGGAGLSDDDLKNMATDIGADIDSCVDEKTYRPWVKYTTQQAAAIGVTGTPTVFVDGQQWGKGDQAPRPRSSEFLQARHLTPSSRRQDPAVSCRPGCRIRPEPGLFLPPGISGLTLSSAMSPGPHRARCPPAHRNASLAQLARAPLL